MRGTNGSSAHEGIRFWVPFATVCIAALGFFAVAIIEWAKWGRQDWLYFWVMFTLGTAWSIVAVAWLTLRAREREREVRETQRRWPR